jgi:hypothetical protein
VLTSGIVDMLTPVEGFTVTSTTHSLLGVWNVRWSWRSGAGSSRVFGCGVGWVAHCWALRNQAAPVIPSSDGGCLLVFLWLFGCCFVDASIFVAFLH